MAVGHANPSAGGVPVSTRSGSAGLAPVLAAKPALSDRQGLRIPAEVHHLVQEPGDLLETQVDLPPCISGVFETTVRDDTEGHQRTATLGLFVTIKPDDTGALQGQAEGMFKLEGSVQDGDCAFSYNTSAPVTLDLKASGSGDGPFTIDAVSEQKVEEVQRHYLCNDPIDLSIDWDVGLNIEDIVFAHGSYEFHDDTTNIQLAYSDPDFWNKPP